MAINVTNSQGTEVWVCPVDSVVTDKTSADAAMALGAQVGCIQSLGAISTSRSVQEYTCMSADESAKSFGSKSLGNVAIELLFDSSDAAGQAALRSMYDTNVQKTFIIVLSDGTTSPTYISFNAGLSSEEISAQKDNAVMYSITAEISSLPNVVLAV